MRRSASRIFRLIGASASIRHITSLNSLEGFFGRLKNEFFRGQRFPDYDTFKAELDEYITYWNTGRYQECLDGMTPEAFRLAGGRRGRNKKTA